MDDATYKLLVAAIRNGQPPFNPRDKSRDASAQWIAYRRVVDSVCFTMMADAASRDQFRHDVSNGR